MKMKLIRYSTLNALLMVLACTGYENRGSEASDVEQLANCAEGELLASQFGVCVPQGTVLVHGQVKDSKTGAAIQGVTVSVFPSTADTTPDNDVVAAGAQATTDSRGMWTVTGVAANVNVIVVYEHSDYSPFTWHSYDNITSAYIVSDSTDAADTYAPGSTTQAAIGVGFVVMDASAALVKVRTTVALIRGTVYGEYAAATGATVELVASSANVDGTSAGDPLSSSQYYTVRSTTTSSDGVFSFQSVVDEISPENSGTSPLYYYVHVLPFDKDGDTIADFQPYLYPIGILSDYGNGSINLTNIVVLLTTVGRELIWASFANWTDPAYGAPIEAATIASSVSVGCDYSDDSLYLTSASAPVILHFGAEIDQTTVDLDLVPVEILAATSAYGTPLTATTTYNTAGNVMTITPGAALVSEDDQNRGYALIFRHLAFTDGTKWVDEFPASKITICFLVGVPPTPPTAPTPSLYGANEIDVYQGQVNKVTCDQGGCWLTIDGFLYKEDAVVDTFADVDGSSSYWGEDEGLDVSFSWPAGAKSVEFWVLKTPGDDEQSGFDGWYKTNAATVVDPSYPNFSGTGWYNGLLKDDGVATTADWDDYRYAATGPALNGNGAATLPGPLTAGSLSIFVRPLTWTGLGPQPGDGAMLTLADTWKPTVLETTYDFAGASEQAVGTELGNSFRWDFKFKFQEYVVATGAPMGVSSLSSTITSVGTPQYHRWDNTYGLDNLSTTLVTGPHTLRSRGACTEVLGDAESDPMDVDVADDELCVRDGDIFSAGNTLFIVKGTDLTTTGLRLDDGDATNDNPTVTISSLSTGTYCDILQLSASIQGAGLTVVEEGDLVCAATAKDGHVVAVSGGSITAGVGTKAGESTDDGVSLSAGTTANEAIFGPGTTIGIWGLDSSGEGVFQTATVALMNGNKLYTTSALAVVASAAVVFPLSFAGVAAAEYAERDITEFTTRVLDASVSGSTVTLSLKQPASMNPLTAYAADQSELVTCKQDDLVMIDLLGQANGGGSEAGNFRRFGKITDRSFTTEDTAGADNAADNAVNTFIITLGAPGNGLPGLSSSDTLNCDDARFYCLGDAVLLAASTLSDPAGNTGLFEGKTVCAPDSGGVHPLTRNGTLCVGPAASLP